MNIVAPIELLKRQYLQLTDPEELTLPRKEVLRLPDIQAQIYNDMFDESNIVYAPPERYRFRVLKRLVKALEDAVEDPEEDVGAFFFSTFTLRGLQLSNLAGFSNSSPTDLPSLFASRRSQMPYRGAWHSTWASLCRRQAQQHSRKAT